MSRAPSPTQAAILAAMASRGRPLIVHDGSGFVPTWGAPPIPLRTISSMDARGLIARADRPGRVYDLTEAGRNAALNVCTENRARPAA